MPHGPGGDLFAQGSALIAQGQYDGAVKAFRRGLRIRGDWSASPFRLDQLYGDDVIAKTSHLENLAKAVEANPLDAELLTALGIQLYFDGQRERAGVFLARGRNWAATKISCSTACCPSRRGRRERRRRQGRVLIAGCNVSQAVDGTVLRPLHEQGLLDNSRGEVTILDRPGSR